MPDQPKEYYDALPAELKAYNTIETRNRDKNYFLYMYLADVRAVDYLASRPDWDGKTLVVMGTSMGGQQSLCAAGLNPKVTAMLINVPAGADANGNAHGRKIGYPFWDVNDPQVMKTAEYFDTVNCAARIKVPSLVSMGFIDTVDAASRHLGRVQPDQGAEGSRAHDRIASQSPGDTGTVDAVDATKRGLAQCPGRRTGADRTSRRRHAAHRREFEACA